MQIHNELKSYTQEDINDAYRSIFDSPKGRIVMLHLCQLGYVGKSSFCADPVTLAFREGLRRFALEVIKRTNTNVFDLSKDLEEFELLFTETEENDNGIIDETID